MGPDRDVVLIFAQSEEDKGDLDITTVIYGAEYESFWIESGRVVWKLYGDKGTILIHMKIDVLMEGLLGDQDFLSRLTTGGK